MKHIIKILIGITLLFLFIGAVNAADNSTTEQIVQDEQIDNTVQVIDESNTVKSSYDDYGWEHDYRIADRARVVASSKSFTAGKTNNYKIYARSGRNNLPHAKVDIYIDGFTKKDNYISRHYLKRANRYGFASISLKSLPVGKYTMSIYIHGNYGQYSYANWKDVTIWIKNPTKNYRKITIKPGIYTKKYIGGKLWVAGRYYYNPYDMVVEESYKKRPVDALDLVFTSKKVKMYKVKLYIKDLKTGKSLQRTFKGSSWIDSWNRYTQGCIINFNNKRYDIVGAKIYFTHY